MASKSQDPLPAEPVDSSTASPPKRPGPPKIAGTDPPEDDHPKPFGLRTDGEGIEVSS